MSKYELVLLRRLSPPPPSDWLHFVVFVVLFFYLTLFSCQHRSSLIWQPQGKIGEIVLEGGDTLMLATTPVFLTANARNPCFALLAEVRNSDRLKAPKWKRYVALGTLLLMMVVATAGVRIPPVPSR